MKSFYSAGLFLAYIIVFNKICRVSMSGIFVYPPDQFDMFTKCPSEPPQLPEAPRLSLLHNVDFFFVKAISSPHFLSDRNTTPDNARLFVVPVHCSQSFLGRCGNHSMNIEQMRERLSSSYWFKRYNGADHFVLCDDSGAAGEVHTAFPNIIIGHKEAVLKRYSRVAVGDTTYNELLTHVPVKVKPLEQRKYDFFFAARTAGRERYKMKLHRGTAAYIPYVYYDRQVLWCDYVGSEVKPSQVFVTSGSERDFCSIRYNQLRALRGLPPFVQINFTQGMQVMAEARTTVSLTGDTPTTDRIFNAFETETVVQVLSRDLNPLLEVLAFTDVVPWRQIFHIVNATKFDEAPLRELSKLGSIENLPLLRKKVDLMRKFKDDVLWISEQSRAHLHVLKTAMKERQRNVQEYLNLSKNRRIGERKIRKIS